MIFNLDAQTEMPRDAVIEFLCKYSVIHEPNPIHQHDSSIVNNLFITTIINKNIYSSEQRENLRLETFKILYANARGWLEDSTDSIRMNRRRMLLYMTLALLSPEEDKFYHFLECAKTCSENTRFSEIIYQDNVLIRLTTILMLSDSEYIMRKNIEQKFDELVMYVNNHAFSGNFLGDLTTLIESFSTWRGL
jgi:hypothetical protein